VLLAVLNAVLGMAMGLFVSAFASTEFQAVQFMPAFLLPQFLLSGLLGRRAAGADSLAGIDGIRALPDDLISALETRAIWAKFGL
jgi:ABC-2 type transport system permease protein